MSAIVLASASASSQSSSQLLDIVYSRLAGDNVQINFVIDGQVGEPGSFSTDEPARIAFDFFGTRSNLDTNKLPVQAGQVESVVAVEAGDRTRIIVNLYDTARYELLPSTNGYSVTVYNSYEDKSKVVTPKPFGSRPDVVADSRVNNIDFRRSPAGGGSLTIDMSEPGITVDTRQTDGEIVIDLLNITLPAELERRLDVVDFATPVQTVDAFQNDANARLVIVPQGKYQHLSFQSGNRYTLVVDPIVESEEDKRNSEDAELGFNGERLSINFQKIDIRSALAVIADFTGINFVTSDAVEGEITINLKDVPWDQALDVIMRSKGLAKRESGNVIWIAPAKEIQEFEAEQLKANAVVQEYAALVSEIVQINYAKATDIAEVIKKVGADRTSTSGPTSLIAQLGGTATTSSTISSDNSLLTPRGSVTVDERTNSLLIQDIPNKITELRVLIDKLDRPVRQVLIETRIVEATDTFSRELGARLGFQRITENAYLPSARDKNLGEVVSSGTTEGLVTIQNSQIDDEPGLIFDTSRGTPGGLAVDLGANAIGGQIPASYAFDIFRAGTGYAHLITLELSALESDGRGKVVASPRLVTANQKEATISQGEERVFTIFTEDGADVETKEAVLELKVTPQITPDDRVIMDVNIVQDSFIANADPEVASALRTKEIVTQVLADNGETIVIGGIYQEEKLQGETKVPFLGDVPIIGNLFKKRTKRDNRTELLIFLTPKIISPKLNLG